MLYYACDILHYNNVILILCYVLFMLCFAMIRYVTYLFVMLCYAILCLAVTLCVCYVMFRLYYANVAMQYYNSPTEVKM